jgi:DNA-binding CsgD family transcriptional regulator
VAAWDAARSAAEKVAPAEPWRQDLADRLHEAAGGHHATVFTCPLGQPERGAFAVTPVGSRRLAERVVGAYVPCLPRMNKEWLRLYRRGGVVVPVVDVLQSLPVTAALRDGRLASEGVAGYLAAFLVTPGDELAGWLAIGSTRPASAVLAEIADPLGDVAARATRMLAATLDLARSCGAAFPDHPEPVPEGEELSAREREIVALVAEGLSDLNISARLSICESTVGSHLRRVYKKLGVHSRVELVQCSRRLVTSERRAVTG